MGKAKANISHLSKVREGLQALMGMMDAEMDKEEEEEEEEEEEKEEADRVCHVHLNGKVEPAMEANRS